MGNGGGRQSWGISGGGGAAERRRLGSEGKGLRVPRARGGGGIWGAGPRIDVRERGARLREQLSREGERGGRKPRTRGSREQVAEAGAPRAQGCSSV